MKHTTHRLILTGIAIISLATVALVPAVGEAHRPDAYESIASSKRVIREVKKKIKYQQGYPGYQIDPRCPGQGARFQMVPPLPNPFARELGLPQTQSGAMEEWLGDGQHRMWMVTGDY